MKRARSILLLSALILAPISVRAERRFVIGNQYDFVFGETNQGGFNSAQLQSNLSPYYGFYPSIDVKSLGRSTVLTASYTGLAERFSGKQKFNSFSHAAEAGFAAVIGRRLKLDFKGSFFTAPSFTGITVLRAAVPSPESFQFVFEPALGRSTMRVIRGGFDSEFAINYRSHLAFNFTTTSLNYLNTGGTTGSLLDQTRAEGRAGYWHNLNPHQGINFEYIYIYNDYSGSGIGQTHSVVAGYSRQLSPALRMHVEAGPAQVNFDNLPRTYGYNVSAFVARTIRKSELSLGYHHAPGDSSGFGSLSDFHSANFTVFSPLWRKMELRTSFSGFYARGLGTTGPNRDYQGVYGALDLSYPLSDRWFLTWGGAYQRNLYSTAADQEFKRAYISIRFRAPELWRPSL